jgi:hypothetical protein
MTLRVSKFVLRREGLDVNRVGKRGDVIRVPDSWRRSIRVNKDSCWDRFEKRIVLRVQMGICHPGK